MTTTIIMHACDACGSSRICEVEDRDDATGYHASEARCLDCGASAEYQLIVQPALEPFDLLSLTEKMVASLAVLNYRKSHTEEAA